MVVDSVISEGLMSVKSHGSLGPRSITHRVTASK